jgi:hypothetical protein
MRYEYRWNEWNIAKCWKLASIQTENVMKRKISEYERFMALSDAEKDREVAKYDRGVDFSETRPLNKTDRRLLAKARGRGRPRIGQGSQRIQITMERGLLARADALALKRRITRAQLVAEGVLAVLGRDASGRTPAA